MSDSFARYYGKEKYENKVKRAYRISGIRLPDHQIRVIEGRHRHPRYCKNLRVRHHSQHIPLQCAASCHSCPDAKAGGEYPVNLSVPVNLRNYFPSESARNFFSVITVGYDFGKIPMISRLSLPPSKKALLKS